MKLRTQVTGDIRRSLQLEQAKQVLVAACQAAGFPINTRSLTELLTKLCAWKADESAADEAKGVLDDTDLPREWGADETCDVTIAFPDAALYVRAENRVSIVFSVRFERQGPEKLRFLAALPVDALWTTDLRDTSSLLLRRAA